MTATIRSRRGSGRRTGCRERDAEAFTWGTSAAAQPVR
jgi:hypothetical protein